MGDLKRDDAHVLRRQLVWFEHATEHFKIHALITAIAIQPKESEEK